MTELQIPYGSQLIDIDIAGILLDLESKDRLTTPKHDVLRLALKNPIDTKKLSEIVNTKNAAKIVVVIDDHTRNAPTEAMLDALTEDLNDDCNITLLVACGTHSQPTEEDLKRMLGKHLARFDINIKIHDCDAKDLVYVGTTTRGTPVSLNKNYIEADIKILTGDITLHYYAGFGGGRKSILPGISSREAIQKNHALLVDNQARTANIDNNPVHLDMSEAASFAPPDIVLNAVTDATGTLVDAYAGEMNAVFLKGAAVARDMFRIETNDLFDVLLVSAGGFPKDRNLYQALKAVENCYRVLVPGGKFILVAECRDGIGDTYFEEWMNKYTSYEATEEAIKTNFVLGGHKAYYMRKTLERVRLSIVSELDSNTLTSWGLNAYKSVPEALNAEIGLNVINNNNADIADIKAKIKIGILRNGLDTLLVQS